MGLDHPPALVQVVRTGSVREMGARKKKFKVVKGWEEVIFHTVHELFPVSFGREDLSWA